MPGIQRALHNSLLPSHNNAQTHSPNTKCWASRGEKKILNDINARSGEGALRYFLPDAADPSKRKPRVASDAEKIFLLVRF